MPTNKTVAYLMKDVILLKARRIPAPEYYNVRDYVEKVFWMYKGSKGVPEGQECIS